MAKTKDIEVRDHAQEREWLLRLGNGDIVEGAQNIIRQILADQPSKEPKTKGTKTRK